MSSVERSICLLNERCSAAELAAASLGVTSSRWQPSQSGMYQPFSADLAEQPLTPDTPITTACRDDLERFTHP
jgi:hypothetical protein